MCAIVGYVGGRSALEVVVAGLERLTGRVYDSAGVAILSDGGLATAKKAGPLERLAEELRRRPLPSGPTGVGHIRRATLGGADDTNAHPQLDNAGRVAVVHDGMIDNHAALRAELAGRGHAFASDTDTEVVAHLLAESYSSCGDLTEAMRQVHGRLEGAYAVVAVAADEPDTLVAACRDALLVVGVGEGEYFVASDAAAFADQTRSVIEPGRDRVVEVRRDAVLVLDPDGVPVAVRPYELGLPAAGPG
ncbi:glucosamine--fructose-6-phosphate aminotransferase [Streptomyces yaizuensis]|uniref:Glutamine--fructose-6-phosphate aminotransferase [isomerizing] n=1 Tax=Streptomyces yaizuensis TaxID=2989713 RepID=A0ABQ5P4X4_9ACTN|nr:glucosamine--fructose-6-phosphate aminotransferase [Streptomyces sp. YSPA8]